MPRPMVPRFRVIRLRWRRSAVAQAATIRLNRPKIDGMNFHAPHDPARSQTTREAFLASLPPAWRAPIFLINDAGAACVNVELKAPVSAELTLAIGRAAEAAFGREVTLNQWWTLEDVANGLGGPWKPGNEAYLAKWFGRPWPVQRTARANGKQHVASQPETSPFWSKIH